MKRISTTLALVIGLATLAGLASAASASAATYADVIYVNGTVAAAVREQGPFYPNAPSLQVGAECRYLGDGSREFDVRPPIAQALPGYSSQTVQWRAIFAEQGSGRQWVGPWVGATVTATTQTEFGGSGDSGANASLYSPAFWNGDQTLTLAGGNAIFLYVQVHWMLASGQWIGATAQVLKDWWVTPFAGGISSTSTGC